MPTPASSLSDSDDETFASRAKKLCNIGEEDRGLKAHVRFKQWLVVTKREIFQHKLNFCLGFFSCFLVVLVVVIVMSTLDKAPVIFLRLAEASEGEVDLKIVAEEDIRAPQALNYTLLHSTLTALPTAEDYKRNAPRVTFETRAYVGCPSTADMFATDCYYSCHADLCDKYAVAEVIAMDTERERSMDYGRTYEYGAIPSGQAYIHSQLAATLGVAVGQTISLNVHFLDDYFIDLAFHWLYETGMEGWDNVSNVDRMNIELTVAEILPNNLGKAPSESVNTIFVELQHFNAQLVSSLHPEVPDAFVRAMTGTNYEAFVTEVAFNLPGARINYYLSSSYDEIQERVVAWGGGLLYNVGFNQVDVTMPVLEELRGTRFFSLFLGLILNIIISILTGLSIILIYSLLMINVETRTFELGVMRMVGTTRQNIIELMLVHAFSYAVPSYITGLIVGQILFSFIARFFSRVTNVDVPGVVSVDAVLIATFLGLAIPMAASIFPIRSALGRSLLESLDTKRSKTKAVEVSLSRSEDSQVSWTSVVVGVVLVAFAFAIYYVLPLALVSFNLSLLLNMFFALILCMLAGLALLALNLEPLMEFLVITAFFSWWETAGVLAVVKKNLVAHRIRNRKTTILYSVSIAVIIFLQVTYQLQINSITYQAKQEVGGLMVVEDSPSVLSYVLDPSRTQLGLNVKSLEDYAKTTDIIDGYGFYSGALTDYGVNANLVMNIGQVFKQDVNVFTVTPGFFEVTSQGFLKASHILEVEGDDNNDMDISEALYTVRGSFSCIVGTSYQRDLGLEGLSDSFLVEGETTASPFPKVLRNRMQSVAMLSNCPKFSFSRFIGGTSDMLVSLPTFVRLSQGRIPSVGHVAMKGMIIRLKEGATDQELDALVAGLKDAGTTGYREIEIVDYRLTSEELQSAGTTISAFFTFTTVMAMMISYFSLVASMYTNIYQQTKEIAILRALGFKKFGVTRAYIEEAFALVFSAAFMGVLIGTMVGYTMTLQRVLFTQLPIPFIFPYSTLVVVFVVSLISALASSLLPIRRLLKQPIVQIMRLM